MTITQLQYIEEKRLSEFGLNIFFKKVLDSLREELQRLRKTIYEYDKAGEIFDLNERSWVGVLNNAISRAYPDSSVTLQEYGVYNKSSFVGRADILVFWKDIGKEPIYLLFEAKSYEETKKSELLNDAGEFLNSVRLQGKKYYDAELETNYYKDKIVFIIPIAFGLIRRQHYLSEAKKYFNLSHKKDNSTDFCSLYFEGEHGAWSYGKVYNVRK
ncbi:MAG TPA: hypothetical protein PK275_08425 [Chitinophagaceae bacterium]|nr:hypothetical protein [Chitinophagaceae bacterium]